jgi:hypothetical protein
MTRRMTRKNDRDKHWIFPTREKAESFKTRFKLESNDEEYYEIYSKTIDPDYE